VKQHPMSQSREMRLRGVFVTKAESIYHRAFKTCLTIKFSGAGTVSLARDSPIDGDDLT